MALGRRRRDSSYTRLGRRAKHDVVQDLLARLGACAEIPAELRHPHVLRHTFATRYYRKTRVPRRPPASAWPRRPKTTMVYADDAPDDRERLMLLAVDEPPALDVDRAA